MRKKQLLAGVLAVMMLLVTACGQGNDKGGQSGTPSEPPVSGSQQETPGDTNQPDKTPEETPASYIFSDMPIAAYEVTGLSVGLDAEVYQEHIFFEGEDVGTEPLVRLDPSKSFLLLCTLRTEGDEYDPSIVKVRSPEGSDPWTATMYSCHDNIFPDIEGYSSGYPALSKTTHYTYSETDNDGGFYSLNDPWTQYITFSELWHPGASDAIHVIEVKTYDYDDTFDTIEDNLDALAGTLKEIGAVDVREVPVEEALTRCNIAVAG